jgi:hypothetical protein
MKRKLIKGAAILVAILTTTGCVQEESGFSPQDQNFAPASSAGD